MLGLTPDTIYMKIASGELEHYKLKDSPRGRIRISEKQLKQFLEKTKNKGIKVRGVKND